LKEKLIKLYNWSNSWSGTIVIVLLVIFFLAQAFIIPSGSMKNTLLPGDALFAKKFAYGIPTPHIPWIELQVLPDFRGDGHLIDGPRPKREDIVIFRYPLDIKKHFVKRCFAVSGDEVIYDEEGFWIHPNEGDSYLQKHYKGEIKKRVGKLFVLNPYMTSHKGIHYSKNNLTFMALRQRAQQLADFAGLDGYTGFVTYDNVKKITKQALEYLTSQSAGATMQDIDVGMGFYLQNGIVKYFYLKLPKDYFLMIGDNRDESFDSRFWGAVPYKYVVGKPWFIYMSFGKGGVIRWNRVGKTIDEIEKELNEGKKPYEVKGCDIN